MWAGKIEEHLEQRQVVTQLFDLKTWFFAVVKVDADVENAVPFLGDGLRQLLWTLVAKVPVDDSEKNVVTFTLGIGHAPARHRLCGVWIVGDLCQLLLVCALPQGWTTPKH